MSIDVVIQGGRVVCGATGTDVVADVHLAHNRIAAIIEHRPGGGGRTESSRAPHLVDVHGARVIDARGCIVMPGMIDLGVHLRDPGREHDEDLATTLVSALRGGVTTLVALPDTSPPVDGSDDVLHRRAAAQRALGGMSSSEGTAPSVIVAGCLTRERNGKEPADIADMKTAGVDIFGDAAYIDDAEVLRRSLEYARGTGAKLALLHGPASDLARGGVVVESAVSTRLGLPGVPELADAMAAWRHIEVARLAGMPAHLGPIFTAAALAVIERAFAATSSPGSSTAPPSISASVHPWHLLLDERAHLERRYDTLLRLDPPLPTAASRAALVDAVKRGALAISSGHRAVPNRTKDLEMAQAEAGAASLALTLPLLLDVLTPLELARATSALPARILGLADRGRLAADARADLVILRDLRDGEPGVVGGGGDVVDAQLAGSRAPANPWLGLTIHGRVEHTLVGGRVAYTSRRR